MKKLILTLIILCVPFQANSMLIPTTPIGQAYNDGWWFSAGNTFISPGNKGGFAYGFSLDQGYSLSSFTGFIQGLSDHDRFGVYPNGNFQLTLYQGSSYGHDNAGPFPSNNIIHQTERFSILLDGNKYGYNSSTNLDLEAGEYWLGFQGGGPIGQITTQAKGYQLEGEKFTAHTPEPMTLLLLGGGLLFGWRMRKK